MTYQWFFQWRRIGYVHCHWIFEFSLVFWLFLSLVCTSNMECWVFDKCIVSCKFADCMWFEPLHNRLLFFWFWRCQGYLIRAVSRLHPHRYMNICTPGEVHIESLSLKRKIFGRSKLNRSNVTWLCSDVIYGVNDDCIDLLLALFQTVYHARVYLSERNRNFMATEKVPSQIRDCYHFCLHHLHWKGNPGWLSRKQSVSLSSLMAWHRLATVTQRVIMQLIHTVAPITLGPYAHLWLYI